jgi:mono/diheme cytochrome c family protein
MSCRHHNGKRNAEVQLTASAWTGKNICAPNLPCSACYYCLFRSASFLERQGDNALGRRWRGEMKGIRLSRSPAMGVCALLALALGGCASLDARSSLPSAPGPEPVRSAGEVIFDKWCSDCHRPPGGPGSVALQRKYHGSLPAVLEQRTDLLPLYVTVAVRNGVSFMPSFRKTEISDADLALVAAYLAHSQ